LRSLWPRCRLFWPRRARRRRIEIFDAHLHFNSEPTPFYSLAQVLALFKQHRVTRILATSRPNDGTRALVAAKPEGLWVVPFIRPKRHGVLDARLRGRDAVFSSEASLRRVIQRHLPEVRFQP
jgi:hypothetical protein